MKKLFLFAMGLMVLYCGFTTYQIKQLKTRMNEDVTQSVTYVNKTVTGFSTDLTKVIKEVESQTVHVEAYDEQTLVHSGSGFVFSSNPEQTVCVTSASFLNGSNRIVVRFDNGEYVEGTILGIDEVTEIAVISTIPTFQTKAITLGDSSIVSLGEWVIAIGSEGRNDFSPSISVGLVSGINRPYTKELSHNPEENVDLNVMITNITLYEGVLGGAIVNMQGECVGIPFETSKNHGELLIMPIEEVVEVVRMLMDNQVIVRPTLGITTQKVSDLTAYQKSQLSIQLDQIDGLYITFLSHQGPCDLALMQKGDILLAIDGVAVEDYNSMRSLLYTHQVGDAVELTVLRGNNQMKVMVTLQ